MRVESGAVPQRCLPAGLERYGQVLPHRLCDVSIETAHPRDIVAEPLLSEYLRGAILGTGREQYSSHTEYLSLDRPSRSYSPGLMIAATGQLVA